MGRTSRMLIVLFSRGVRGHSSPGKILQFGGLGIPFGTFSTETFCLNKYVSDLNHASALSGKKSV